MSVVPKRSWTKNECPIIDLSNICLEFAHFPLTFVFRVIINIKAILFLLCQSSWKDKLKTLQNISHVTSRVTKCLFHTVVFVFLILFDSEQSLDDSSIYIVLKDKREALHIVLFALLALKCAMSS